MNSNWVWSVGVFVFAVGVGLWVGWLLKTTFSLLTTKYTSSLRFPGVLKKQKLYSLASSKMFFGVLGLLGGALSGLFFHHWLAALAGIVLAGYGPHAIRGYRIKRQHNLFFRQMVDGLSFLAGALRVGTSFSEALERWCQQAPPPTSEAWGRLLAQIRTGIPQDVALAEWGNTLPERSLSLRITTLSLLLRSGGNVPETLTQMAQGLRDRLNLEGKLAALTAQGRASAWIVGAMPFILLGLLGLLAPELIQPLFNTTLGQLCLLVVMLLVSLGAFFIKKIVVLNF